MKKLLTITAVAMLCCIFAENTQAQAFQKGTKNLNVGLGLGYGVGLNASVDVGIHELISVGAIGAFSSRNYSYYLADNFRVTYIAIGARGAVHIGKFVNEALSIDDDKFDPYIGLSGGFRMVKYNDAYSTYYGGTSAGIFFGGYAGARYYFKDKLGVYAEAGFPYTSLGITLKF
ncbi:hypothetical protein [Emticicia sp. BO119]|uniref:hypothetical protein n=1 Tax=Emticicia sp. BO119 TaxID=2757768 RepID=UPI0015F02D0D|nr:hypothetical protein [Emticicia sp. BO119]MBA4851911.1 hypothetical protein [Emticicia sp. BO119]